MRWLVSLSIAALFAACSSDDRPKPQPGTDGGPRDGSETTDGGDPDPDGGGNGADRVNPGDTGVVTPDTGVPDSGLPGGCNPENGSGCTGTDSCVYVSNLNMSQCRMLAATPKQHEEVCDQALHDCAAGFTCVRLPNEAASTCKKVCLNANDQHCQGLQGAATNGYFCPGAFPNSGGVGICFPTPDDCQPFDDMCPAMQYCDRIGQTQTGCLPEGSSPPGGPCMTPGQCARGGVCVDIGSGGKCYPPCNPAVGTCGGEPRCIGLLGQSFGICADACDVFTNTCPQNENCEIVSQSGTGCIPAGAGAAGQPCMQSCARGTICVNQVCRVPCDAANACATGMCNMLQGFSFGICL